MSVSKIRIDKLSKTFGEDAAQVQALRDFSLTVADGEFVCLVGPSGCGKTTVLRIVAGLERPTSGAVDIARDADSRRPQNAMVFQEHGLFPWMTVAENAALSLEMRGIGKTERRERVAQFLEMIGLTRFADHYPQQLSGGMRQRVGISRALAVRPAILLMDEPLSALDSQTRELLMEDFVRLLADGGMGAVYVTHNLEEAARLADRIVVMTAQPGRIKAIVPVNFPRPRSAAELRGDPRFGALQLSIWRMLEDEVRTARLQAEATR